MYDPKNSRSLISPFLWDTEHRSYLVIKYLQIHTHKAVAPNQNMQDIFKHGAATFIYTGQSRIDNK